MQQYKPYQPTAWEQRIDAAIRLVAPKAHFNRTVSRERSHYFRYLAALPNSARRNANQHTSGETLRGSREKQQVMWNAINMIDNSGLGSSIISKLQSYTCGLLRWQARTGDKAINDEYEDAMRLKLTKALDYTGRFSLRQMCMLDIKGILVKGDIGTNIVREGPELYLQGIEADRIGNPNEYRISNNYVRGLEIDDTGRIEAVRIYRRDRATGTYKYDDTFRVRDKRGLPSFLFLVSPISYDDYRGVSSFKTAIDNSTYIDRMREYELQAMLWASTQSGVFHTTSGELPEKLPFDQRQLMDASGNFIDTYQVRPNTVTALGLAEKVEMFPHERPSPNVIAMYNDTRRDICIGAGVSFAFGCGYDELTGPGVRAVSSQDARAIEVWQWLLRESKLDPVMTLMLGNSIANGELPFHPNWMKWEWFFPSKSTIDVGRESAANIEEIEAGINTGAKVAADDGQDIDEIKIQRGKEIESEIEIAMEIAKNLSKGSDTIDWREVYMRMNPMRGKAGMAKVMGPGQASEDGPGATSDGVALEDGGGGNGSNGSKKNFRDDQEIEALVISDGIHKWYREDQERESGRFADEGKGSEEPGYKHPGDAAKGGAPTHHITDKGEKIPLPPNPSGVWNTMGLQARLDTAKEAGVHADASKKRWYEMKAEHREPIRNVLTKSKSKAASADITPSDYATKDTTTTFDFGRQAGAFEIKTKSGASVNGYLRDQDFPNDTPHPKRGEIFLTSVPEAGRNKGTGYSLNADAIKLLKANGAETVNLSPVSEGGKRIVEKLKEDGLIHGPLRTSKTGKAEYSLTAPEDEQDADLGEAEKGWMKDFRSKQKEFEKTGKLGVRYDAVLTGERTPKEVLTEQINFLADYQRKNLKDRGLGEKEGFKYGGLQDYLQSEGKEFDPPSKAPQIKLMTPKECYSNATHMALDQASKYDYVEGVYVSPHLPYPIDHAWVVDKKTGTVVDPTLGWQPKGRYFGVPYSKQFLMKKMRENKYYGIHSGGMMVSDVVLGKDKDFKYKDKATKAEPTKEDKDYLKKGIKAWITAPDTTPGMSISDVKTHDSEAIRGIRGAAQKIRAGETDNSEYGKMAKAMLAHAKPVDAELTRGTASGYFGKWDAKPEEILSKFPVGEDVDLTLFSFSKPTTGTGPAEFAKWAMNRVGGYPMYITLEKGAEGVDVSKYSRQTEARLEKEVITTGKARVISATFDEKEKHYLIKLGK